MHMSELGGLAVIGEVIGYQKQKVEGRRFVSVGPLCLRGDRSAQRRGLRMQGRRQDYGGAALAAAVQKAATSHRSCGNKGRAARGQPFPPLAA